MIDPVHSSMLATYAARIAGAQASAPAARSAATARSAQPEAIPAEAPARTDAKLWGVLTEPERTYFARAGRSVVYGPQGFQRSVGRGLALDVRG